MGRFHAQIAPNIIESSVVSAGPGDDVENIATSLRKHETASRMPVLFFRAHPGETSSALDWLDVFAQNWTTGTPKDHPWGDLAPLPLIILQAENLSADDRQKFIGWGISSFTDETAPSKLESALNETLIAAAESGAFLTPTPSEVDGPPGEQPASPETGCNNTEYAAAFHYLSTMGKGLERID